MEAPNTHTVQNGESLSMISQKYYGDFSMVEAIASLNKISNKDVIYPGQVLMLPSAGSKAVSPGDGIVYEPSNKEKAIQMAIRIGIYSIIAGGVIAIGWKVYKDSKKEKKAA